MLPSPLRHPLRSRFDGGKTADFLLRACRQARSATVRHPPR
ncbi:Uncharacterised protein [Vibrio cholerae]|nr:Uncharacterised protein [Vibrio cholerae]